MPCAVLRVVLRVVLRAVLVRWWCAVAAEKPQWLRDLAGALCEQFKQYKDDHQLQRVIHRYLGALLASVDDKKVINSSLETMLNTVNHADDTERQGVSQGLGFCGSKHLDTVLPIITGRLDSTAAPAPVSAIGAVRNACVAVRCAACGVPRVVCRVWCAACGAGDECDE